MAVEETENVTIPRKIAVIGSFRQHNYGGVREVVSMFGQCAAIMSPDGSDIVSGGEFVRFSTDDVSLTDEEIQTYTLERIFRAEAVFVVAPDGYVGRTTCYEIGRIVQRRQPIYFSEHPIDLPVQIPKSVVVAPEAFMVRFLKGSEPFMWLFDVQEGASFDVERRIATQY